MSDFKICPICGKCDVTNEHIEKCEDVGRWEEQDNLWK